VLSSTESPAGWPNGVVDELETVHVQHDDREQPIRVTPSQVHLVGELAYEEGAVGQARQTHR